MYSLVKCTWVLIDLANVDFGLHVINGREQNQVPVVLVMLINCAKVLAMCKLCAPSPNMFSIVIPYMFVRVPQFISIKTVFLNVPQNCIHEIKKKTSMLSSLSDLFCFLFGWGLGG